MSSTTRQRSIQRFMRRIGFVLSLTLATSSLVALNVETAKAAVIGAKNWTSVASSDDGTKLVVTEAFGDIYTSSDSGASWINRSTGSTTIGTSRNWGNVASSADGTRLAVTALGYGIFTSSDSGATWVDRSSLVGAKNWSGVSTSADGMKLVALVGASGSTGEIWTSADGGDTWTDRSTSFINSKIWNSAAASDDGTKVAAAFIGGFATSTDSGATWVESPSSLITGNNYGEIVSSGSGDKLAASIFGYVSPQILISTDSGSTWTESTVPGGTTRFWGLASSSDGTRLITASYVSGSVYVSSDSGATWSDVGTGITPAVSGGWQFASSADGMKLVGTRYGGCIYTSSDAGTTWKNRCEVASPSAPGKPTVVEGNTTATLSWTASTSAPLSYTVVASPGGQSCTVSAPTTTCEITGLTNGTPYTFVVTATNDEGSTDSAPSDVVTIQTKVTQLSPSAGSQAGGTAVTITGNLFAAGATVTIGGAACTDVVVVSATSITCVTPANTGGLKEVVVTNTDNSQGSKANAFRYTAINPTFTSVAPSVGATTGSTPITITGTGFNAGATVYLGATACTSVVVVSATSITCVAPVGTAGATSVRVVNTDGGALLSANAFTYVLFPTASTVEPNAGPAAGGTSITITGTDFAAGATVTVGGAACTDVVVVSATSITCVTPAANGGAKDIVVTNTNGGTVTSLNGFTYDRPFRAVTFKANGGTGTLASTSNNEATALPANTFARTGYVFKGWNTKAKGNGVSYANNASYSYDADLTLYAQWTAVQSGKKLSKNFSIFAGDQAVVNKEMKSAIASWVKKLPKNANITCVGSTQGNKVTSYDTKLATSRAKNVCAEAVKVRSDLKYTLKANPSSSLKATARSVWIYQK